MFLKVSFLGRDIFIHFSIVFATFWACVSPPKNSRKRASGSAETLNQYFDYLENILIDVRDENKVNMIKLILISDDLGKKRIRGVK
jgi:hypothetical protein